MAVLIYNLEGIPVQSRFALFLKPGGELLCSEIVSLHEYPNSFKAHR